MTQEALKLALEALEKLYNTNSSWWQEVDEQTLKKIEHSITAIKESLAQTQEPVHNVQSNGRHSPLLTHMMNKQATPPQRTEPLTDDECDAIYAALNAWAKDVDDYAFGLPTIAGEGMEAARTIIRAANGIKENT